MITARRRPCAAPLPPNEPDMFGAVPQPRTKSAEPDSVYADVLALRRAGRAVMRAGRSDHLVDGQRVSRATLAALAKAERAKTVAAMAKADWQQFEPQSPPPPRRRFFKAAMVGLYDLLACYADVRLRRRA